MAVALPSVHLFNQSFILSLHKEALKANYVSATFLGTQNIAVNQSPCSKEETDDQKISILFPGESDVKKIKPEKGIESGKMGEEDCGERGAFEQNGSRRPL